MYASNQKRPKPRVPRSSLEWRLEFVGVLFLLFIVVAVAVSWPSLPATIPTHFGVSGQPNSYGDKSALLVLPIVTVFIYLLLTALSFFPSIFNFPWPITEQNASAQYRLARTMLGWLKVEMVALFAYITLQSILAADGEAQGLSLWFLPVALVVVFFTIGWYIRLLYRAR